MLQKVIDDILRDAIEECSNLQEGTQCRSCLKNAGDSKLGIICVKKLYMESNEEKR